MICVKAPWALALRGALMSMAKATITSPPNLFMVFSSLEISRGELRLPEAEIVSRSLSRKPLGAAAQFEGCRGKVIISGFSKVEISC